MLPTPQQYKEMYDKKIDEATYREQQKQKVIELMNKAMDGNAEITTDEIAALCTIALTAFDSSQCPSFLSPFI